MDFFQTIFKTNNFLSWILEIYIIKGQTLIFTHQKTLQLLNQKVCKKTPEFDASYDSIVTESKGMQKTPEFDASYDPVATESKGMLKTPEFDSN